MLVSTTQRTHKQLYVFFFPSVSVDGAAMCNRLDDDAELFTVPRSLVFSLRPGYVHKWIFYRQSLNALLGLRFYRQVRLSRFVRDKTQALKTTSRESVLTNPSRHSERRPSGVADSAYIWRQHTR